MSLAWSAIVVLVALLPGFTFLRALGTSERFTRDSTPRNPIGQLALIVLVSVVLHGLAVPLLDRASPVIPFFRPVDLRITLACLLATNDAQSLRDLAGNLSEHSGRVVAYVLLLSVAGFFGGRLLATSLLKTGWGAEFLFEHGWLHEVTKPDPKRVVEVKAFVLTKMRNENQFLMYKGRLHRFGVRGDGRFSYVVLERASKFYFLFGADQPETSKASLGIADRDTAASWLYLDGEDIANVFFGRYKLELPANRAKAFQEIRKRLKGKLDRGTATSGLSHA